jgi:chromosome segregation ATPase
LATEKREADDAKMRECGLNSKLQEEVQRLNQELDSARQKADEQQQIIGDLQTELANESHRVDELQHKLTQETGVSRVLQEDLKTSRGNEQCAREDAVQLKQDLQASEKNLSKAWGDIFLLRADVMNYKATCDNLQDELDKAIQRHKEAESNSTKAYDERTKTLEHQWGTTTAELLSRERDLKKLGQEHEQLKGDFAITNAQLEFATKQMQELVDKLNVRDQKGVKDARTIEELRKELATAKQQLADQQQKASECQFCLLLKPRQSVPNKPTQSFVNNVCRCKSCEECCKIADGMNLRDCVLCGGKRCP